MTSAIRRPKNIPIALSSLSETQKRALRIADNKIALNAGIHVRFEARHFCRAFPNDGC